MARGAGHHASPCGPCSQEETCSPKKEEQEPVRGQNNSNFKKSQNRETVKWRSKGRKEFYTTVKSRKPRRETGNKRRHPQPDAGEAQWAMKGGQWETVSNEGPGGVHLFR